LKKLLDFAGNPDHVTLVLSKVRVTSEWGTVILRMGGYVLRVSRHLFNSNTCWFVGGDDLTAALNGL